MTAREDRLGQLVRFSGAEDEDDVGGGFFQRLEQGLSGGSGDSMDFIDNIDLPPPLNGRKLAFFDNIPHLLDPRVAGSINLPDIQR